MKKKTHQVLCTYPCGIDGFDTVLDRICNDLPMGSRDKNYKPRVSEASEGCEGM